MNAAAEYLILQPAAASCSRARELWVSARCSVSGVDAVTIQS
jgi:hypothetical protein